MNIIYKKHIVRKLFVFVLTVLILSSAATAVNASPAPSSGTLTIHYYSLEEMSDAGLPNNGNEAEVPSNAAPLAGAAFTVWQVDPVMAESVTSASEAWQYLLDTTEATGVTNADGELTFSLDQGLYYVMESDSSESLQSVPCEPFLVSVPMVDPATGGWITDVHAYPKSQSLAVDKFVAYTGTTDYQIVSKNWPVAVGEEFNWYIRSQIPQNIGTADTESIQIIDPLDAHFDYQPGTLDVYIMPESQSDLADCTVISEGTDYTVNFDTAANTLTVELTEQGIETVKKLVAEGGRYSVVAYSCEVNETAPYGVALYSGATLVYTRETSQSASAANRREASGFINLSAATGSQSAVRLLAGSGNTSTTITATVAQEPEVHTGKIAVTKLADSTGKPLAGAEFGIAESKADALAGNFLAVKTSDANGELTFYGLRYGLPGDAADANSNNTTFWLVETKAPDGYKLLENPVEVTFNYQQDADTGKYYFARLTVYDVLKDATTETTPKTTSKTPTAKTGDTAAVTLFVTLAVLSLAVIGMILVWRRRSAGRKRA